VYRLLEPKLDIEALPMKLAIRREPSVGKRTSVDRGNRTRPGREQSNLVSVVLMVTGWRKAEDLFSRYGPVHHPLPALDR